MTYPQGPYGPQDPYNQGGYPPTGGFPQQGGGYPPPPPKKSNTALIVSIVAVVVLALGALGITGFVAPGFFLSDEKGDGGGPTSGAQALAQSIVDGFNAKDTAKLQSLKCANADEDVDEVIAKAPQVESATLGEVKKNDESSKQAGFEVWSAQVTVTVGGQPMQATGLVGNQDGKWCWGDVELGGDLGGGASTAPSTPSGVPPITPGSTAPSGGSGSSDLKGLMEDFLSKVNSGDVSGAQAVMCADGVTTSAQEAVDKKVNLALEKDPDDSGTFSIGDVAGTDGEGQRRIGSIDSGRADSASPWCIEELRIY